MGRGGEQVGSYWRRRVVAVVALWTWETWGLQGGMRLLEWIPSQKVLVKGAKLGWTTAFRTMLGELAPQSAEGAYIRPAPQRGSGEAPRLAKESAYVLYVGNPCPWCHRTTAGLAVRGAPSNVAVIELEDAPERASRGGWVVESRDPVFGASDLKGVYDGTGETYGRATAPLLLDASTKRLVSRESGDILRAICDMDANDVDLRPPFLKAQIDALNDIVYEANDGVYRCGFATTQRAYDRAEADLHTVLHELDAILADSRFLIADKLTETDLRLFPTAARFDAVYATLFRCGRRRLRPDYPNIQRWLDTLYAIPSLASTIDLNKAQHSYYTSLFPLNPSGIVPKPPDHSSSSLPEEELLPGGGDQDDLVAAGLAFSFADRPVPSSSS